MKKYVLAIAIASSALLGLSAQAAPVPPPRLGCKAR